MLIYSTNPPVEAVISKDLSTWAEERYVIVHAKTREVLDDAQGYGYRSVQKALAAWAYKHSKL